MNLQLSILNFQDSVQTLKHSLVDSTKQYCKQRTLTFAVKLDGVTVRVAEAPRTVEDGSSLRNVDLPRVGLGSSDHHTHTANQRQKERQPLNCVCLINVSIMSDLLGAWKVNQYPLLPKLWHVCWQIGETVSEFVLIWRSVCVLPCHLIIHVRNRDKFTKPEDPYKPETLYQTIAKGL